ncbi:proteasome complex subunit rpn13 ubiquitin receptor domain protein [Rhizoctonia solani AG-3 Rhs1AP]|uniref:Proteasome complex subunit rpn13 ubiquitin receptor domain protein n=2 Tax=Rhizoctonia solani AG-3 TaxID=1086053 RepID=A0A074SB84_9AGAM|nr:proteasome complex subunit rpn13 ubiquitin receptor domain protein [Rhizoctonia solani AG-3 Rhs1AP]KEP54870.1 proteasome complex subunit rpn13 ubiquitin receptor domain protein [Rhizoctonia solani 123E]
MTELVSIKAGRAFRREGTNFIDSESTRGTLLLEAGEDDLLYLRWRTRDGDTSAREDLDPDGSQDASNIERINTIIAEFDPESIDGTTANAGSAPEVTNNNVQGAPTGPLNPEQLDSVVQEILRNLQGHSRAGVAPALSDILTPSTLTSLLQDPEVVGSLTQFLPPELLSSSHAASVSIQELMKQTVASAPFRASVRSLDQALSTGLLGGLVTNLGMPVEAGLGIHPFLEAIKAQAKNRDETMRDGQDERN